MKVIIKRFGEHLTNRKDKWYETNEGVRVSCVESVIEMIWWKWIVSTNAKRADKENYTIFEFAEPQNVNL